MEVVDAKCAQYAVGFCEEKICRTVSAHPSTS